MRKNVILTFVALVLSVNFICFGAEKDLPIGICSISEQSSQINVLELNDNSE